MTKPEFSKSQSTQFQERQESNATSTAKQRNEHGRKNAGAFLRRLCQTLAQGANGWIQKKSLS
jgi:hypothetical protein